MTNLYLTNLYFSSEHEDITDAVDLTNQIIEFAEGKGLVFIDGATNRSREREPVEQMSYSSSEPFRNKLARDPESSVLGVKGD